MFVPATVAPGLAVHAASEAPQTLAPRTDALATLAILVIGLVVIAGAIRSVFKQ